MANSDAHSLAGDCFFEIRRLANTTDRTQSFAFDISDDLSMFRLTLFQDCSFNKLQSDTDLEVLFQGNTRVCGSGTKCNRWYFKFNGNECTGPMTIEAKKQKQPR